LAPRGRSASDDLIVRHATVVASGPHIDLYQHGVLEAEERRATTPGEPSTPSPREGLDVRSRLASEQQVVDLTSGAIVARGTACALPLSEAWT
jgi:hypothetical protein